MSRTRDGATVEQLLFFFLDQQTMHQSRLLCTISLACWLLEIMDDMVTTFDCITSIVYENHVVEIFGICLAFGRSKIAGTNSQIESQGQYLGKCLVEICC